MCSIISLISVVRSSLEKVPDCDKFELAFGYLFFPFGLLYQFQHDSLKLCVCQVAILVDIV